MLQLGYKSVCMLWYSSEQSSHRTILRYHGLKNAVWAKLNSIKNTGILDNSVSVQTVPTYSWVPISCYTILILCKSNFKKNVNADFVKPLLYKCTGTLKRQSILIKLGLKKCILMKSANGD